VGVRWRVWADTTGSIEERKQRRALAAATTRHRFVRRARRVLGVWRGTFLRYANKTLTAVGGGNQRRLNVSPSSLPARG